MPKDLFCTLGPASLNEQVIPRLAELGATLFRVNLSHTKILDLKKTIGIIQSLTDVPVCLDTEGAQIRTGDFAFGPVELRENSFVEVSINLEPGSANSFNIYPRGIVRELEVGDFVSIDFNSVLAQVVDMHEGGATLRVLNGGKIGGNKAITVARDIAMPALTEKDVTALEIGKLMGVRHFALSFANQSGNVDEIRRRVGVDSYIISKIETLQGLANLEAIAKKSDCLLIDRGDLSRQVALENIPATQKFIIRTAKSLKTPVVVATNLLESMVTTPLPTRAEVNDVYNTLADGADGLVLAAETAIGQFPIRAAKMIATIIRSFERTAVEDRPHKNQEISFLVPPHGGALINRVNRDMTGLSDLPQVTVSMTDLLDCEQVAIGTYSPLTGFMNRETLESVLSSHRLPDGTIWTMPIVLQISESAAKAFSVRDRIALVSESGDIHAVLDVSDMYRPEMQKLAQQWFGTSSSDHPGVARVFGAGPVFVGGNITLTQHIPSQFRHYALTPAETRILFAHKGWTKVAGFHTRNVIHRAHEYLHRKTLRDTKVDGLLISPAIGPKKKGDFHADSILESYQLMFDFGLYPINQVVLGAFSTYSRYSGPREAVFTALCRKNMGCSHFIMGRDHTGVGNYYAPDALPMLMAQIGDLGIEPVIYNAVAYDPVANDYTETANSGTVPISGSDVRRLLENGENVPEWLARDIVVDMLRRKMAAGQPVFQ